MSTFIEHCEKSIELLGDSFESVHEWLDELSWKFGVGHRQKRHHIEGIKQVCEMFGERAALAALIHVIDDLLLDDWRPEDGFPLNESDYILKGLFTG